MGINRGKQFENEIRKQLEKIPNTFTLRLYDVTTGYANQNNPCDFIVFKDGTLYLLELKAIHGTTLNFKSHIRENQWNKLLKYNKIPGINAGILCWFIDLDKTYYVDISSLQFMKEQDKKSFNVNEVNTRWYNLFVDFMQIKGKKKKVFFDYDLKEFLDNYKYIEWWKE